MPFRVLLALEAVMKDSEEIMRILEAFDLTGSYRAAAELVGCDHHTVKKYVLRRDAGEPVVVAYRRKRLVDPFLPKIEEWVERGKGRVRADRCFEKLVLMGFTGSERSIRRAVAEVKRNYRRGQRRVYRPWVTEPGLWLQFDWAEGPLVAGRPTNLFCAWLAWSRYRVVIPTWDRKLATLISCLDRTFRLLGGVSTYVLTDNEKTVTSEFIASIPVRHPVIVRVGEHYGVTIATCVRADPETKGGSEATVRIAKADLLPSMENLGEEYESWGEFEGACEGFMARVNNRVHSVTRRVPAEMLLEERQRLHRVPSEAFAVAFGEERTVDKQALVLLDHARYSVPHELAEEKVLVREQGNEVVITHLAATGAREVARHERARPGGLRVEAEHYPPEPEGPLDRTPKPGSRLESDFLNLGDSAAQWLKVAAASGVSGVKRKMRDAVELAGYYGPDAVASALGTASEAQRFGDEDLRLIIEYQQAATPGEVIHAPFAKSLQRGTRAWEGFGR